jgi:signal transduction histidine kinase
MNIVVTPRPEKDTLLSKAIATWNRLSLARKFTALCALVVLAGALLMGLWVSSQIREGVTRNTAVATALYVDSFISPLTRELETGSELSIGPIRALDEAFQTSMLDGRILSVKIWRPDGTIVYSSADFDLISKKFPVTEELKLASAGQVTATFDQLTDPEDAKEREAGIPILEIYSPIRAPWSGKVIAIAEFYENGTRLAKTIAEATIRSWFVVGVIMTGMAGALMTIVFQGSRTIDQQRQRLQDQLLKVTRTSEQNRMLSRRLQNSSERVSELNEQFLRRTGAELHDGAAQLLSFAALRIGEAGKIRDTRKRNAELETIKTALDTAMKEIRDLSRGLSLPEIGDMSLQEIILRVVRNHTERTGARVESELPPEPLNPRQPVKICVYRFVQEALNNHWKHAGSSVVAVTCRFDENTRILWVAVVDDGPGFDPVLQNSKPGGLGINGLRERVQSIGGQFSITGMPGNGTTLELKVSLDEETPVAGETA